MVKSGLQKSLLHPRIAMELQLAMCLMVIEPIGENILLGQEYFLPPYAERRQFVTFLFFGSVMFFELSVHFS